MANITGGFVKISRIIKEWGWYDDPNTLALWIHLLIEANWKDGEWHGEVVKRGQLITSVSKLSASTGLSAKQVRMCIDRLVAGGEIIKIGANKWTKITICKYDAYQCDDDCEGQTKGEQMANKGQAKGEQRATIEEYKKERIEEDIKKTSNDVKERFVKPTVEEVAKYCAERHNNIDAEAFVAFYESKGWKIGTSPMKNWKSAVITWEKKRKEEGDIFQPQQQQEQPMYGSIEEWEAAKKANKK